MTPPATLPALDPAFVAAFRNGTLSEPQAETFVRQDSATLVFQLLELSALIQSGGVLRVGPHTPSGAIPPFLKPTAEPPKPKKRGAKPGHPGAARPAAEPNRFVEHEAPCCPDCRGQLVRTGRKRTRIVEDIPANIQPEVTQHTIHRDWCPKCKKQVEPIVPDALPNSTLGHRTTALAAWFHYDLGLTTSRILSVFNAHLHIKLTDGGLTEIWHRLASILDPWYQSIRDLCLKSGVLHADETGWRVDGSTWWLWCFTTQSETYYLIDDSRGRDVLDEFFGGEFQGTLVTDFWAAYTGMSRTAQKCWPHLLRELKEIDKGPQAKQDWPEFAEKLRRIYRDAVNLAARREQLEPGSFDRKVLALDTRMTDLAVGAWTNPHAVRLAKRLFKHGPDLLTFVEIAGVPSDNNHAERTIRPAVEMRKLSYGNRSEKGAATRSVLMSVLRTLKLRGLDPLATLEAALRTYTTTGQLPTLPEEDGSAG